MRRKTGTQFWGDTSIRVRRKKRLRRRSKPRGRGTLGEWVIRTPVKEEEKLLDALSGET